MEIDKMEINNGETIIADVVNFSQPDEEFFKPDLSSLEESFYVNPTVIRSLSDILYRNRLLVISGSQDIDKSIIARYIAFFISDKTIQMDSQSHDGEKKLSILEWDRSSSDPQKVEAKLRKTKDPTIFILPRVSPQDVRYDLLSIKNAAELHGHLVLISSDLPQQSWNLPAGDLHFWTELPEDTFRIEDLICTLNYELDKSKEFLPPEFWNNYLKSEQTLISDIQIQEVAIRLKTPEIISRFVTLLREEKQLLRPEVVWDLIEKADNKYLTIERWYHNLNSHEQLLALGLSLFDGLFDDQFFAAIDRVVEKVWQKRDSSLRALDYCDLSKLRIFFDFVPTKEYGVKIESNIQDQRKIIFEVAWNSHRRQILTALPIIAQLAIDSAPNRSHDPELYGSNIRREQLRMVISDALSDLGLVSLNSIQRTLSQLAADRDPSVQAVAARAVAQWREDKRDDQLFWLLDKWINSRENFLHATAALAVYYSASYDPHNGLDSRLCDLLEILAKDNDPMVRSRFCNYTLYYIIPRHINQLKKILHDMTEHEDLILKISENLAFAYSYNYKDVVDVLESWQKECQSLRAGYVNSTSINLREKLLATIILTYGQINYTEEFGALTADDAVALIKRILAEEKHFFVRENAVLAVGYLAKNDFKKFEPYLQQIVADVVESESNKIIQILTDIYLRQRRELGYSNDSIEIDGIRYPIWIYSERQQTAVEAAMFRWIKESSNPAAQQIALRALVAFSSALDQREDEEKQKILEQREQENAKKQAEAAILPNKLVKENKFIEKIMIFVAALGASSYRAIIKGIMPEVLAQNRINKKVMTFVQDKWHKSPDSEIRTIANLLNRAVLLIDHAAYVFGIFGLFILLFSGFITNFLIIIIIIGLIIAWLKLWYIPAKKEQGIKISLWEIASEVKNKIAK